MEQSTGVSESILVVDDDPDIVSIITLVLRGDGRSVISAGSGAEALGLIRDERPAAALLDFMLPDMSGLELLRRARELDPDLPCVAVTGQGNEKVAVELMKAGALDYLVKPFETSEIAAAARRALEERRVRTSPAYRLLAGDLAEKNAQLERQMAELSRRVSETTTLAEAGRVLTSKLDLGEVLAAVMQLAGQLFKADASSIRLVEEGSDRLMTAAHSGLSERYLRREPVLIGDSAAGAAAFLREPVHVLDVEADARFRKGDLARREGLRSLLCLPLLIRDQCIGVVTFYHRTPRAYAADELQFLGAFASTVSIAVDNARLYAEQSRLAVTDGLTGLYNHKHLHETLAVEFARARRYQQSISLILSDIDHFKHFNDAHGHQAGDALLRDLAALLRKAARENDLVARYGGEEFAILLPQTAKPEAVTLALRICRAVARRGWEGAEALPGGRLTLSLGVAAFPEDVQLPADLVHRADQALYLAKSGGRNRVEAWRPTP